MTVTIRGRNIEISSALKDYVEKRLSKLEKFVDDIDEAQVTLTVDANQHRVEVTIPLNGGYILRGEESTDDMYTSVDLVVEKLIRQIEKYKGRFSKKGRGPAKGYNAYYGESDRPKVVRNKKFAVKPMDLDEAIMQMNMLGHNFFVFYNMDSRQINVVYCRKDGNYGLIEPEF